MDEHLTEEKSVPSPARPEKLIRTFAGDMETLRGGSVPNLVPFRGSASVPAPAPASAGEPISVPPLAASAKPTPLQTYADDFSQRMKETHASAATVLAVEQDSAIGAPRMEEPQASSRGNLLYVLAGIVLLAIGGAGAYVAYTRYAVQMQPIILAPTVAAPIFVDEREQISGTGTALAQAIVQSATRPLVAGIVRFLHLDPSTATESVFSSLRTPAPDILRRNIRAAGSMAGIINVSGSQSPFFILSVVAYSDTFSGMLAWEPKMPNDLAQLFPPHPSPLPAMQAATSTMATSTAKTNVKTPASATTTPSVPTSQPGFIDKVVANHDTRAYRDAAGKTVLLYGYWNQTTLVIARDEASFVEILGRLATSRSQ